MMPGHDGPEETALRVVFCHDDPRGGRFDPDPSETGRRNIEVATRATHGPFAAIGWGLAGLRAAELAAMHGTKVPRLVLCAVPAPNDEPLAFDPTTITAKTLLLYGQLDEAAPPRHAQWWKDQLPKGARVEIVPGRGDDFISAMWGRILSHAAPRTLLPPP